VLSKIIIDLDYNLSRIRIGNFCPEFKLEMFCPKFELKMFFSKIRIWKFFVQNLNWKFLSRIWFGNCSSEIWTENVLSRIWIIQFGNSNLEIFLSKIWIGNFFSKIWIENLLSKIWIEILLLSLIKISSFHAKVILNSADELDPAPTDDAPCIGQCVSFREEWLNGGENFMRQTRRHC